MVALQSCMPTLITCNTPNADVYVNGTKKGVTPLKYNDVGFIFTAKNVKIEKEGFEPTEFKIRKSKRLNPFALATLWGAPWCLGYSPYYRGVLKPNDGKEFFKPDCLTESPKHSNKDLKLYDMDLLSKLDGDYYGFATRGKNGYFVRLDSDFKIIESTDVLKLVDSKINRGFGMTINTFMNTNYFYVFINNPKSGEVHLFKFDLKGNLVEDFSENIKQEPDSRFSFKSSASGNYFSVYSSNRVILYDLELKQIESVSATKSSSLFVGDNGSLIFLDLVNNEMFMRRVLSSDDDEIQLFEKVEHNSFDFSLDVYPELNKIYISSLTNDFPVEKKGKFPSGVKGAQVSVVSYDDFDEEEYNHILYTDLENRSLLTKESGSKKSKGSYDDTYSYLNNKGVKATKEGYTVINQEIYVIVSDNSSRTVYGDLVISNILDGADSKTKAIKHLGYFIAEVERNYIHFISQSMYGSGFIEHMTLDSKLDVVGYNIKPFRKTKNIVVAGRGGEFNLDGHIQNTDKSVITIFEPKTYRAYTLDYID